MVRAIAIWIYYSKNAAAVEGAEPAGVARDGQEAGSFEGEEEQAGAAGFQDIAQGEGKE